MDVNTKYEYQTLTAECSNKKLKCTFVEITEYNRSKTPNVSLKVSTLSK
jgi:hypothetical protein